jgi:hypothetical protein
MELRNILFYSCKCNYDNVEYMSKEEQADMPGLYGQQSGFHLENTDGFSSEIPGGISNGFPASLRDFTLLRLYKIVNQRKVRMNCRGFCKNHFIQNFQVYLASVSDHAFFYFQMLFLLKKFSIQKYSEVFYEILDFSSGSHSGASLFHYRG